MQHTAQPLSDAFRTLENPPARLPLPACLKDAVSYDERDNLIAAIRTGVEHHGLDWKNLSRLTIAWPQKDPRTEHVNAATGHADKLCGALTAAFPDKQILRADALYETRTLGRSEKANMEYTLTARQSFAVDPALQNEHLPFLTESGAHGEAFILTDWISMQGTTLAALASFITHNGGHVVAVALPYGGKPLLQRDGYADNPDPRLPRHGQLQPLGAAFKRAAMGNGDYDAAECVALFDYALRPHGMTLRTLTHHEALTLYAEMSSRHTSFTSFVEHLGVPAAAQTRFIDNLRRSGGPR